MDLQECSRRWGGGGARDWERGPQNRRGVAADCPGFEYISKLIYCISFSCSVYEIQTQIFFGLDHNMKKSIIITIYCVFGCQIASYELDTPVYRERERERESRRERATRKEKEKRERRLRLPRLEKCSNGKPASTSANENGTFHMMCVSLSPPLHPLPPPLWPSLARSQKV